MNTWNIPDEVHNAVGAVMEENAKLKTLCATYAAACSALAVKAIGASPFPPGPPQKMPDGKFGYAPPMMKAADVLNITEGLPVYRDLPPDVLKEANELRAERYGIK